MNNHIKQSHRSGKSLTMPALQRVITLLLIIANISVLTLHVSGWSVSTARKPTAQDANRVINKKKAIPKDEPIEINDVKIKGKSVGLGETFEEDAEWLKKVDFRLKNKWGKAITYLVLNFDFPETEQTGSMMMYSLYLGQRPDVKSTLSNPPLHLKQDQSIDVSLAPRYEEIRKLIEIRQTPVGEIKQVTVWLDQAMFEDGTLYSGGRLYKRNPDHTSSRKWVLMTDEQSTQRN